MFHDVADVNKAGIYNAVLFIACLILQAHDYELVPEQGGGLRGYYLTLK